MSATGFYDAAQAALSCICSEMDRARSEDEQYPGCPCRSYVTHGTPALDECCDWRCDGKSHGQLTVHVEDAFPTDNFPIRGQFIHPCAPAVWVASLVVTVARCVPVFDESGHPPSEEASEASARVLTIDLRSILVGLTCCLPQTPPEGKRRRRVQLGAVQSIVGGGCGAYTVGAFVEVGQVCPCPPEVS